MNQDITNILNLIEEVKTESKYSIKTSSDEILEFVPMTADDQKSLIKALVDSPYYSNIFNMTICEILNKCFIGDGSLFDKNLDQYDKTLLIIKTRSINIDDTLKETLKDSDGKDFEKEISLEKHLKSIKSKKPLESIIEDGSYKIVLDYPKLKSEYEIEKYIVSNLRKIDESDHFALKGLISLIFIANVIKYIKTLTVKETEFDFSSLTTLEKFKVGSSLSSSVIKKIVSEIDGKFSKGLDSILTAKFKYKGEDYDIKINIDNTFFIT
jgi:hypothetical protein